MLCRVDLDRLSDGQRGANGIRAAGELIPARPGHEPDVLSRFERPLIARGFQNDSGRIGQKTAGDQDRKSTRLNSSHLGISYAVFCLKKKKKKYKLQGMLNTATCSRVT